MLSKIFSASVKLGILEIVTFGPIVSTSIMLVTSNPLFPAKSSPIILN